MSCVMIVGEFCSVDRRFPVLTLIVKHWAINAGINDAMNGSLNSYSLVLLVVHYLQFAVRPPILPSLQALHPHLFSLARPADQLAFNEPLPSTDECECALWTVLCDFAVVAGLNTASAGELLVGFFAYYSRVFDARAHAISIRHACLVDRRAMDAQAGKYALYVEEPYDLANTARCVREGVSDGVAAEDDRVI